MVVMGAGGWEQEPEWGKRREERVGGGRVRRIEKRGFWVWVGRGEKRLRGG